MLEGTRDNSDLNILNGDVTLDDEPTFLRSSNLNFDFSVNQDSQDMLDMSKIIKTSHNSTMINSEADKELLDVINQSSDGDNDESMNDYQNLLTDQRSNITGLYTRINKLECKKYSVGG